MTARKPLRILIADDEAVIRLGLRAMLEDQGYQVVGEAADGHRALDLVQKLRPDLVFLDIKMPGVDGLEAARAPFPSSSSPPTPTGPSWNRQKTPGRWPTW